MGVIKVDVLGKKFNRLFVLEELSKRRDNKVVYKCLCDCGNTTEVTGTRIKSGITKSCGCLWREAISLEPKEASFNALYAEYKLGAENRDLEFELTKEQFREITTKNCFYCNIEPKQLGRKNAKNKSYIYNGIDRKNNKDGYKLYNCLPCCRMCNIAKATYTEQEFYNWCNRLYNNLKEKELV